MTIAGMTLYQIGWYFLFYSFCGWVVEVIFHALSVGKIINRGFLNGPLCPVYGFGVLAVAAVSYKADEAGLLELSAGHTDAKSLLLLFLASTVFATLVELIAGWLLNTLFHMRWWDYSNRHFHFHGYICLGFSLIWGLAITGIILVIHPLVMRSPSFGIPARAGWAILETLYTIAFADLVVTVAAVNGLNRRLKELDTLQKNMRVVSDRLSRAIGGGTIRTAQKVEEGQVQAALAGAELREALGSGTARLARKAGELSQKAGGLTQKAGELTQKAGGITTQLAGELARKPGEWKDARLEDLTQLRQSLENRRDQLLSELSRHSIFDAGHILRNVPELRHRDYREILEALKEKLPGTGKEKKD